MFVFSLLFWGFTMTTSFLSPALSFNKEDWFCLQSLPVWGFCTVKTVLLHGLHTMFVYWYICIFIYIFERYDIIVYPFGSLFLEIKWFFYEPLTSYSFCFSFHLEVICSLCVFHLWYREKLHKLRKPLLYYLVCK